ncbi:MAG: hypothetical protein ACKVQS_07790 [Fimbriimonadaceae bacterium]
MELKDPIELHLQRVNSLDRRQFLRPMTSSEKLERSARIYQLSARKILAKTLLPSLFCFVSLIFGGAYLLPSFFVIVGGDQLTDDLSRVGIAAILTIFLAIPLFMFGLGQCFASAVAETNDYITGDRLPGEPAVTKLEIPNPWKFTNLLSLAALESFLPILAASICFLLGAVIQSAAPDSIVPGLLGVIGFLIAMASFVVTPILFFRNCLVPVVAVLEKGDGKSIRTRARMLARSKGNIPGIAESMLHGFVVFLIVGGGLFLMFQIAINLILGMGTIENWLGSVIFGDLIKSAGEMLPLFAIIWLLTPFWAALSTVNYYDRRIKLEGFDIRMLAKDVLEVRE